MGNNSVFIYTVSKHNQFNSLVEIRQQINKNRKMTTINKPVRLKLRNAQYHFATLLLDHCLPIKLYLTNKTKSGFKFCFREQMCHRIVAQSQEPQ